MHAKLTARTLGFAGLIPFYAFLAGIYWYEDYPRALSVQGFVVYSLAILCFLSGSVWGHARTQSVGEQPIRLLVSNGLVIFGVAAVLTAQAMIASLLLMLGFIGLLWYERNVDGTGTWYAAMRTQLTVGVVIAHLLYIALHMSGL
ncbi:conserved hypothetical protein [Luminiphilus syltensis NOR5-1B]|uniref:DUF3429 domain-containing protein n=1 Tax=Luminiphilus syltensis NOR5-1B TaxID=565045 RepID=B8KXX6_9GAMM|nr:DUF3429 domain-containing protein [Luminiphilus syltensis]EED35113.1 conserved hypothetical protein [Luminiphilus syltensis NOR5-1B]